jgi:hypothetical protein
MACCWRCLPWWSRWGSGSRAISSRGLSGVEHKLPPPGVRSREGCAPAVLMRAPMAILDSVRHDVVYLWKQWSQNIKEPADADMLVFFGTLRRERSDLFIHGFEGDPWHTVHSWLSEHERTRGATKRAP